MGVMKKTLLVVGLTALLGSQWQWLEVYALDSYVQGVAVVTGVYCLIPQPWRAMLRELTNEVTTPHKIRVECATDAL